MRFNFKKFGEEIKFKRTAGKTTHDKPFTLKSLAEELGILFTTIYKVEHGRSINAEDLVILGRWANLELYDFLENN